MFKLSIHNFLKKPKAPNELKDYSTKSLIWGKRDVKPFDIIQLIRKSGTAARCADTRIKYLFGSGFANKDIGNIAVNDNETLNDLLLNSCEQLTKLWGFSVNVKYNADFKIAKAYSIPFEEIRLGIPNDETGIVDKVYHNPYWGLNEFRLIDTSEYDLFNSSLTDINRQFVKAGKKWKGQILYYARNDAYSRFYPSPSWYANYEDRGSGKEAMESEYLLSALLSKEIGSGFLQNVVMKMVGDPTAPIPEEKYLADEGKSYTTVGEEFERYLDENFAGIDGNSMIVLWSQLKDEFPELEAFPSTFNYEKLKDVRETIKRDIAEYWDIPPTLVGIQTSGAISKDDMTSSSLYMHHSVRLEQQILEREFLKLVKGMGIDADIKDLKIANYNPYPESNTIEEHIWNVLSIAEKRKWISENTDIELIDEAPALNRLKNESYTDFPIAASNNAKKGN